MFAIIKRGKPTGPTIGLRADMTALPDPRGNPDWTMQATHAARCTPAGHDGIPRLLLGAAKYLAENAQFSGRVALIFSTRQKKPAAGKRGDSRGRHSRPF